MANRQATDRVARSISFEVEATPQDNIGTIQLTSTANTTPLNVKIRVRKKHGAGAAQNAVVSVPKLGKPGAAPQRVRLVSSDQTIVSFNVFMENEKDEKAPRKAKKGFFDFLKPGARSDDDGPRLKTPTPKLQSSANKCADNKDYDTAKQSLNISNNSSHFDRKLNKKGILGKCKPGGCLDPPFGDDRYAYERKKRVAELCDEDLKNVNKKSSKLYKIKLNGKKEKASFDGGLKKELTKYTDSPSHPSLDQEEYHEITEIFSDPLITYPPAVTVSEQEIHDKVNEKNLKNRISTSENKYRTSVQSSAEIYYCPSDRKSSTRSYAEKHKQDTKTIATPVYESSSTEVHKSLAVESSHAKTPSKSIKLMLEGPPLFTISAIQLKDHSHSDVDNCTTPLSDSQKYLHKTEAEPKYRGNNNQHKVADKNTPLNDHTVYSRNKKFDIIQAPDLSLYDEHDVVNIKNMTMVSQSAMEISMTQSTNNSFDLNNEISKKAFISQGAKKKEDGIQNKTVSSKFSLNSKPANVSYTEEISQENLANPHLAELSKVSSNIKPNEANDTNILQTKIAFQMVPMMNDKSEQHLLTEKRLEKNERSPYKAVSSKISSHTGYANYYGTKYDYEETDIGEVASKTAAQYETVNANDSGTAGQKEISTKTITPQGDSWKISSTVCSVHDSDSDHVLEESELITKYNEKQEGLIKSSPKSTSNCNEINQKILSQSSTKIQPSYCDDGVNTNGAVKTVFKYGDNVENTSKIVSKIPAKNQLFYVYDYESDFDSNELMTNTYSTREVSTISSSKSVSLDASENRTLTKEIPREFVISQRSSSTLIAQDQFIHINIVKLIDEVRMISENKEYTQDTSIEAPGKIESNCTDNGVIPKQTENLPKDVSELTLNTKSSRINISELYSNSFNAPREVILKYNPNLQKKEILENETILPGNKNSNMFDKNTLSTRNTPMLNDISDDLLKVTTQTNTVTEYSSRLTPKSTILSSKSVIPKSFHDNYIDLDEKIIKTFAFDVSLDKVETKIGLKREESHTNSDDVSTKNVITKTAFSLEKVSLEELRKLSIHLLSKNSEAQIFNQSKDCRFSVTEIIAETLTPKTASLTTCNVNYNESISKTTLGKEGSLRKLHSKIDICTFSNMYGINSIATDSIEHNPSITEFMAKSPSSNDKVSVCIPNDTTAKVLSESFSKTDNNNTVGSIPIELILQSSSKDVSSTVLKDDHSIFEISEKGSSLKKFFKSPNNTSEKVLLRRKTSSKIYIQVKEEKQVPSPSNVTKKLSARELLQKNMNSFILSKSSTKSKIGVKEINSKTSYSDASKSIATERDAKTLTSMELFSFDLSIERTLEGTKEIMRTSTSISSLDVLEITNGNKNNDIQRYVDLKIDIDGLQQFETNTETTRGKSQFYEDYIAFVHRPTVEQTEFVKKTTDSKPSIIKFENKHSFSDSLILSEKQFNIARIKSKEMQNLIVIAHLNDFDKINSTDDIGNKALSNLEPNLNISMDTFTKSNVGIEILDPTRDGLQKQIYESSNMQRDAANTRSEVQQKLSELMSNVSSKHVDRSQSEIKSEIGTFVIRNSDTSLERHLTELAYKASRNSLKSIELSHNDRKRQTDQYIIGSNDALIVDNCDMNTRTNVPKTELIHKSESIIDLSNISLVPIVALENNGRKNITVVSEVSKPVEKQILSAISVHAEATSPENFERNNQPFESQIQQADTESLRNKIRQDTSKHLSEESAVKITQEGVLSSVYNGNDSTRQSVIESKNTSFISSEYKGLSSNEGDITVIGLQNKGDISQSYTSLSTNQQQGLETKYEDNSQAYYGTKNIELKTKQSLDDAEADKKSIINDKISIKGVFEENSTNFQEYLSDIMYETDHKSKESMKIEQQNYSTNMKPISFDNSKVEAEAEDSPSSTSTKVEKRDKNVSDTEFKTCQTERIFEISEAEERRYITTKSADLEQLNRSEIDIQSLNGFAQSPDIRHQTKNHLMDENEVILLDVAFQSYLNRKNEKVLKSFDSSNIPAKRFKNDTISTYRSTIRSFNDPMVIAIDSSTVLLMGVDKQNLKLTASRETDMNLQNKIGSQACEEVTTAISLTSVENSDKNLQRVLSTVYNNHMVPLQEIIKHLKEDIDSLAVQQEIFRQKISSKKFKTVRISHTVKRCGCLRK